MSSPSTLVHTRSRHRWHVVGVVLAAALTFGLIASCGDGSSTKQAAPDAGAPQRGGGFETEAMANVPSPADGNAEAQPVTEGGTTSQSFQVPGVAADAIRSYQQLASGAGWQVVAPPTADGATDWTMTLNRSGQTLLVTASPAGEGAGTTELSLEVSGG